MSIKNAKCACQGGTLMRFVQPIILAALAQSPDHGYDLLRKLGQTALWRDAKPDATGVYRVLREMEARGTDLVHARQCRPRRDGQARVCHHRRRPCLYGQLDRYADRLPPGHR